jgi:hypothetical protein
MKKEIFYSSITGNSSKVTGAINRQLGNQRNDSGNFMSISLVIGKCINVRSCILVTFILCIMGCTGDEDSNNNPIGGNNNGYSLNVSVSPAGAGTVSRSPNALSYAHGTDVTVKGTAASGYVFKNWNLQNKTYSANPLIVTVNSSATITAVFEKSGSSGGCITFECPTCHGSGKCTSCAGRGYTIVNGTMYDCNMCSGTGKCFAPGCYGSGEVTRCN